MTRNYRAVRGGAVLLGVGAILAAAAAPGAIAQSSGAAEARITRAVLIQANADNTEVSRATLVTQIQVDGTGEVSFKVPVVEGAAPANMDSFGGPTVENGMAVYNVSVDGTPQTFRTSQAYPTDDIPVDLKVSAKLDGKAVDLADLSGVSGDVEITYTAKNLTSTPTTLEYQDGAGNPVTEDIDLVTSMGGTIELTFPKEWSNVQSTDATVVSGDGSGNTLVSGGFTLMEPFGTPEQSFTIKATATGASMPPAVLQFTVLEPQNNPTARSIAESLKGGISTGQAIFDAGKQLGAGADQLIAGLTTATDGAGQLSAGLSDQLVPGVNTLVAGLEDLPATVTSTSDFATVTGGFATLDSAVGGVKQKLGVFSNTAPGQYLTPSGDIDKAKTDVARTIWALIYGVRAADSPTTGVTPATNTGGLTNPACNPANPKDPANPCGAWQVVKAVSSGLTGTAVPTVSQLSAGLTKIADKLTSTAPPGGGAIAIDTLAKALGCTVLPAGTQVIPPGPTVPSGKTTGPTVTACTTPVLVGGPTGSDQRAVIELILGGAPAVGVAGLTQSLYFPLVLQPTNPPSPDDTKSGLAAVLGQFYPLAMGEVNKGLNTAAGGLNELLAVVTTDPAGNPDPNTANGNTATGILNELRAALAQGGVGSAGVPGKCEGYNTPGDPNSGLNTSATQDRILATCAAADVLNLALLVSNELETGVSTTLLEGISDTLVTSVQPLVSGAQQLADGAGQLAAGLPAAVAGVGTIKTDAAGGLQQSGNDGALDFGRRVALYDAMNNPDLVSKYIPGGAPEGDNVSYNGVYKYELAGVGSQGGNTTTALALGLLGLAGAAGVGAFVASRRAGA